MDELEEDAIKLESMIPRMTRILFRHGMGDPLGHLSVAQIRMIRLLSGRTRIAAELSAELEMTPSAVSQATHRLERMGLVVRRPDPNDKRMRWLALSPQGDSLMRERQALRVDRARKALEELPTTHRKRLISSLTEFLTALGPNVEKGPDSLTLVAELEQTLPPAPSLGPLTSSGS